jgi:hypothetical protein
VAYTPDPLSLEWERPAGRALGNALADPGHWRYLRVPARAAYAAREAGGYRLSQDERAFQRAIYRLMKDNERWSLMREWLPPDPGGRVIRVKIVSKASAQRAVDQGRVKGPLWRDGGPGRADPALRGWQ